MLCLRIYDKVKEMQGKPGHVTRVEWQFRGEALRHDMNRDFVAFKNLTIEDCYVSHRRLRLELVPSSLPMNSTLYDILAIAGREGTKLQGLAVFDLRLLGAREAPEDDSPCEARGRQATGEHLLN